MKTIYIFILLVILSIVSLFTGVHDIGLMDIISGNAEAINIMMLTRVPRLVSIITAGMAMSIGGVIMQQISNNKFVSPTTAATMDSAKLGALVSMILFSSAGLSEKMIISFAFSLAGTFIFMKILKKVKVKNAIFIPLVGIMVGNVIGSITDFFAYKYNLVQNMSSFLQGDFSMISKGNYELLFVTVPLLIIAFMYANKFTIIGMGEDISKNLGLNFTRISNIGVTIVALMSALVVITVGSIPFVGLIVPNIVSIFRGDNLSKNIGITSVFGAVFLLACDIIGRIIISPYEVPISLTVGVIGSVVFLYLIFRGK
ncbi:MAG: iron chelate uptake ABC transporter family permease subunit [Clostridium sp.]|uniref:ABC transporter permease n=1 Tax=Clostridium sp. TaxID=1506 RepID=UPI002A89277D|nr:iron chelate uptake ABC transporter family permease subunit [Clostridium sp.]MDY5099105.1 iron chelate uptake ABC transporter family permease subunit [Clostridium sp.]